MPNLNRSSAYLLKAAIDSGITSTDELASFMANAAVETDSFQRMHEYLGYRSVDSLIGKVSSAAVRFSRDEIQEAIDSRDQERIATILYEGRNRGRGGLGNSEPGDGWRYHGRGYFQLTGRDNYRKYGKLIGVDLVSDPDAAAEIEIAARLALTFWRDKDLKQYKADAVAAGQKINGGENSKDARFQASKRWASVLTDELVRDIQSGRLPFEDLVTLETAVHVAGKATSTDQLLRLQHDLNGLGYRDEHGRLLSVDGIAGRQTRFAISNFQRQHDLAANGLADAATVSAVQAAVRKVVVPTIGEARPSYLRRSESSNEMDAYLSPTPAPSSVSAPGFNMPGGGELTRTVQRNLRTLGITDMNGDSIEAHGVYDMSTQTAVAIFQRSHGLSVTGQPDEQTRSVLQGQAFIAQLQQLPRTPDIEPTRLEGIDTQTRRPPSMQLSEPQPFRFNDPQHPQHALYGALKEVMPENTSEKRLAQITAACHEGGIRADRIGEVEITKDSVVIFGSPTGYADVDLNQRPTEEQSLERVQAFDQQQAQELALMQSQRVEASLSPAMVR